VQIGTVMYNTVTGKVVAFLDVDTLYSEADLKPYLMSRWMSPDPLADEYSSWSPYHYVYDNPIKYIDPDGREIWITYFSGGKEKQMQYKPGDTYDGKNKFLQQAFAALNYLNSSEKGAKLFLHYMKAKVKLGLLKAVIRNMILGKKLLILMKSKV
jgi:hypothetical protein